jgi:hypothetical protein
MNADENADFRGSASIGVSISENLRAILASLGVLWQFDNIRRYG